MLLCNNMYYYVDNSQTSRVLVHTLQKKKKITKDRVLRFTHDTSCTYSFRFRGRVVLVYNIT